MLAPLVAFVLIALIAFDLLISWPRDADAGEFEAGDARQEVLEFPVHPRWRSEVVSPARRLPAGGIHGIRSHYGSTSAPALRWHLQTGTGAARPLRAYLDLDDCHALYN
jgi:hypothetical protein